MIEIAIVGAGPYGLSLSAHLQARGVQHRIVGKPMQFWQDNMPPGMKLKSDGNSSDLPDPLATFGVREYHAGLGQRFAADEPITLDTFIAYGLAFQKRFVPGVDQVDVRRIARSDGGFLLELTTGELVRAARVVLATGIDMFRHTPEILRSLPSEILTHSGSYGPVGGFAGRSVAVIGSGASAIDLAAALADHGASPTIIAKRQAIAFHSPPAHRRFRQKVRRPDTGIGAGWSQWFYVHGTRVFRHLPDATRTRIVHRALGAAPGWFMKDRIVGRVPMLLGHEITEARAADRQGHLTLRTPSGDTTALAADHVIAATGYRVDAKRWAFMDDALIASLRTVDGRAPSLSDNFETSVRGLYVIGPAAAPSFGPVMRFVYGAQFTIGRLSRHLTSRSPRSRQAPSAHAAPELAAAG